MIWTVVGLTAIAVTFLVMGISGLVTDPETRLIRQRLQAPAMSGPGPRELRERRRRTRRREALEAVLQAFGQRVEGGKGRWRRVTDLLLHAGYRRPNASVIYLGARAALAGLLLFAGTVTAAFFGTSAEHRLLLLLVGGLLGWMLPFLVVRRKARARQDQIQRSLPDALDLMVVCVEAGFGLNQAMVRVGEEMERVSPVLGEELTLVNLEIRAGTPREEALKHLGRRAGLPDVRAFVTMLVQTDRFGTSIADALRIHADELRTKRRQRAEEAAAKLTVKLLIPIVIFIFPSIFIVILGPAAFHVGNLFRVLGTE